MLAAANVYRFRPKRHRKFAAAIAALGFLHCAPVTNAGGVFNVTDSGLFGLGTLAATIVQADAYGNGAIINIQNNLGTIDVAPLPDITVGMTINGGVGNSINGQNQNRLFFINAPGQSVNINNLLLTNGLAQGGTGGLGGGGGGGGAGLGGAVFVNAGAVSFASVAFTNNAAVGGNGANGFEGGGGGGGGLATAGGKGSIGPNFVGAGGGGGARTSAGGAAGTTTGGAGGGPNGGPGGPGPSNNNGFSGTGPDGGGGGGGLDLQSYANGVGGNGGGGADFSGGGGGGGSLFDAGGEGGGGGFGAGGGGGADSGGAPAPYNASYGGDGGNGGFGGGGGGGGGSPDTVFTGNPQGGNGGFAGGAGGYGNDGGGGGGAALGAAVFVRSSNGASVTFTDSTTDAGSLTAGQGGGVTPGVSGTAGSSGGTAGGALFLMGGTAAFTVSSAAATETIAGSIAQSTLSSITKSGPGTLALTAINSYSGGSTIIGGELSVSADGALGVSSSTVTVNGGLLQIAGTTYTSSTRSIIVGASGGGLDISNTAETLTLSHAIIGSGPFLKSGSGTLALTGTQTFAGGTTVGAGTLELVNNALASSSIAINSGAVLDFSDSLRVFQSGATLTGTGTLRETGPSGNVVVGGLGIVNVDFSPGALVDVEQGELFGSSSYQGNWATNMASLNIAPGALFNAVEAGPTEYMQVDALTGGGTFSGGYSGNTNGLSTLDIGVAGGSGTFSGPLQDDVSAHLAITKSGAGTETFTGTNTYTGSTTVSGGTLVIGSGVSLPDAAVTLTSTGELQLAKGIGPVTILSLTINGGALDITNNALAINYGSAAKDPVSTIRADLAAAYKAQYAGANLAITSSTAAAKPAQFAIGYVDNLTTNQLKIALTVPGDTDLSGSTDFNDLTTVAQFFGTSLAKGNNVSWSTGDVNYDGNVDFNDLTVVAQYFGDSLAKAQAASLPASFVAQYDLALAEVHQTSSVPEPTTMGLLLTAYGRLLLRRRTRRIPA